MMVRKAYFAIGAVVCFAFGLVGAAGATPSAGGSTTFANFSLAATPPSPAFTLCPGSASCANRAAEPQIRSDPAGSFYASSENALERGTIAVRSTDGGLHYASLPSPNILSYASVTNTTIGDGGGDTDIATATGANALGNYNVYVSSLNGADVVVSTSQDKGASWSLNTKASVYQIDDRDWVAATGASKVCIDYLSHAGFLLPEEGLHVDCSSDSGQTFLQTANAYDLTSDLGKGCSLSSRAGNLAFDRSNPNYLYVIAACQTVADQTNPNPTDVHVLVAAVSSDGGKTFSDHLIYNNPNVDASYQNQFPMLTVDKAGTVYAVYSDDRNVFYSFSTDHGSSWHGPFQVSKSGTNLMPWAVAGDAGKLDVVYYHSSYFGDPNTAPATAAWTVSFAQNMKAATAGSGFKEVTATPIIHYGAVCQGGIACTGNRDLLDDFGVAASPVTGLASIVYSDDQYRNDANNSPYSGCTASASNSRSCDHTAIATQLSGQGIYGKS